MDWAQAVSVLFGAFLSLGVSWFMNALAIKQERSRKAQETAAEFEALGFSILLKLNTVMTNFLMINDVVERCFSEAQCTDEDPGIKLQVISGGPLRAVELNIQELRVVWQTGDFGLIEKLGSIQRRHEILVGLVSEFNVARAEYTSFVRESSKEGHELADGRTVFEMPKETKMPNHARLVLLNQLCGHILEAVENAQKDIQETVLRVRSSISSLDGVNLPNVEFPGALNADP